MTQGDSGSLHEAWLVLDFAWQILLCQEELKWHPVCQKCYVGHHAKDGSLFG